LKSKKIFVDGRTDAHFRHVIRSTLGGLGGVDLKSLCQLSADILFTMRFDGVHTFGYNSAKSEPIWLKSGTL